MKFKEHNHQLIKEKINGEKIEDKYYDQELLKSKFNFEYNNKAIESLKLNNNGKKHFQSN